MSGLNQQSGFSSQVDVLINLRKAAKVVGATQMDRTEDVVPNKYTGRVYVNCTKNKKRGAEQPVNAANPREYNIAGHILELIAPSIGESNNFAASQMDWEILLLAGDPDDEQSGADYGLPLVDDAYFGCPDNAAIDSSGRLWITTDGSERAVGICDGVYGIETVSPYRGAPKRLFCSPVGAEVTGPCFFRDGLFLSIQHPGWERQANYENPSTRWPDFSNGPPRPSVVLIQRVDGEDF